MRQVFFVLFVLVCHTGWCKEYTFESVRFENQWRPLRVVHMIEDRFGVLWIGTQEEGLIRYNGVRSTTFLNQPGDSNTLAFRVINQIV